MAVRIIIDRKVNRAPKGILYVLVNGEIVVEDNKQTDKLPGKVLRRSWG